MYPDEAGALVSTVKLPLGRLRTEYSPFVSVVPAPRPAVIVTPGIGAPVSLSVTRPVIVPPG
jgi:hypothetical protein